MVKIFNDSVNEKRNRKWKKFQKSKKFVKLEMEDFFNILNKIKFYSFLIYTPRSKDVTMGFKFFSPTNLLLVTLVIVGSSWSEDHKLISESCRKPGSDYYLSGCQVSRTTFPLSKFDFWTFFISGSFFH